MTDLNRTFSGARKFNGNLSAWDTSGVTDMTRMFYQASVFGGTGVSTWNTAKVVTITDMFRGGYGGHGEEASEMPLTNLCFSPSGEFVLGVSSQQHRQCELHMWGVHKLERSNAEGLPEPDLTYEIIDWPAL